MFPDSVILDLVNKIYGYFAIFKMQEWMLNIHAVQHSHITLNCIECLIKNNIFIF